MNITERLFSLMDKEYANFQAKLMPSIKSESVIGVRVPQIRKLAKEIVKAGEYEDFLNTLPHDFYDENMLHGVILSEIRQYDLCVSYVDKFLPYVDNWAVCDIMSPKCFGKNRDILIVKIQEWTDSELTYTSRFGIEMLMSYYLDDVFLPEYLEIPANVCLKDYYVKMMVAWFFATALAKQWEASIPYLETNRLECWTHNKIIQKARESYRITDERKEYLKSLKRVVTMEKQEAHLIIS